jgi:hypothetical protein
MKANRVRPLLAALGLVLAVDALSGCAEAPPRPTPVAATPAPPPSPRTTAADWRDRPATPGDWTWSRDSGGSVARFGDGEFSIRCPGAGAPVRLERAGRASAPVPMTVTTTAGSRPLTGEPSNDAGPVIGASLPAHDPLLDAMAFSRGRVAVEVAGTPPLYLPAWPEIARVIEDCR